jgi:hypothetical protein
MLLSLFGVAALFSLGCFLMISTAVYLGWPYVKLMNMQLQDKLKIVGAVMGSYLLLMGISCCFYIAILRRRGKFGHSGVGVDVPNDSVQVTFNQRSETHAEPKNRSNPNLNDNFSTNANDSDNQSSTENGHQIVISFNRSQEGISEKDQELKQRLKEINSAVRSLKTNLVLTSILSTVFVVGSVYSNNVGSVVSTLAKGLFPILTTIPNFVKVQELVQESNKNLTLWLARWKDKMIS